MGCVVRTALLSCAVAKAYHRAPITNGRKTSWRRAKKRLTGDTARAANADEVKELRREAKDLREVVAEQTLELRLLKKSMLGDGATTHEVSRIREAGDHSARGRKPFVGPPDTGQAGHPPHHVLPLV